MNPSMELLVRENERLRIQLEEAEQTIAALRAGEVDAVLLEEGQGRVFTLNPADSTYRLLIDQVPHGAAVLTPGGVLLACNLRFSELLQSPFAELGGQSLLDRVTEEDRPIFDHMLRQALQSETEELVRFSRPGGGAITACLCVRSVEEGIRGTCLVVTDLTEHRHYEELQRTQAALRASEARLASDLAASERLQEISTRLIQEGEIGQLHRQILDSAMTILQSDSAMLQTYDETGDALQLLAVRGSLEKLSAAFSVVDPRGPTIYSEALRTRRRVIVPDMESCDFMVGTPALQEHRQVGIRAAQATPLVTRSNRILGLITTHWNVAHQPDERDLRMLDVLARQAADLIEHRQAEQALRDADRAKDEFLATLAHELRNPLAPIRNAILFLNAKSLDHPELEWARGVIDRQVQLMGRLLEDLLDVSRISRNRLPLRPERVELTRLVEAAVETSRPLIEAAQQKLTIEVPSEPLVVEGDPVRLSQVFANLLNNASKYTGTGGRIALTVSRQGEHIVVAVADTGIGIAAELLPNIFQMFWQARSGQAGSEGGLGIGLSLVKGLVELHGGTIEARSAGVGKGSVFEVRLPAPAPSPTGAGTPQAPDAAAPAVKKRILIIDDNPDNADTLAAILQLSGHAVSTVYEGEKGVAAAQTFRPQVVLLDLGMPGQNGYDTCRHIRALPDGDTMLIIAVSGWGQEKDRLLAQEAGFDHHLVKPVDPAVLDALVGQS